METESKTDDLVQVPAKPRAGAWAIARREMKYAIQFVLLIAILITVVSWYRSYHAKSDLLLSNVFGSQKSFFLGADRGTIYTGLFPDSPQGFPVVSSSPFSPFEIDEDSASSSKANDARQNPFKFGTFVGTRRASVSSRVKALNQTANQYLSFIQTFIGHGFYFPHCIVVIGLGTLFVLVAFGRCFTLRGLMIWITVVCLLMGIQIAAANYQPPEGQGVPD